MTTSNKQMQQYRRSNGTTMSGLEVLFTQMPRDVEDSIVQNLIPSDLENLIEVSSTLSSSNVVNQITVEKRSAYTKIVGGCEERRRNGKLCGKSEVDKIWRRCEEGEPEEYFYHGKDLKDVQYCEIHPQDKVPVALCNIHDFNHRYLESGMNLDLELIFVTNIHKCDRRGRARLCKPCLETVADNGKAHGDVRECDCVAQLQSIAGKRKCFSCVKDLVRDREVIAQATAKSLSRKRLKKDKRSGKFAEVCILCNEVYELRTSKEDKAGLVTTCLYCSGLIIAPLPLSAFHLRLRQPSKALKYEQDRLLSRLETLSLYADSHTQTKDLDSEADEAASSGSDDWADDPNDWWNIWGNASINGSPGQANILVGQVFDLDAEEQPQVEGWP